MGGSNSQPAGVTSSSSSSAEISSQRFNSKDLEKAIELTLNYGQERNPNDTFLLFNSGVKCFQYIYDTLDSTERFRLFMTGETGKIVSRHILKALDANGDGRITPQDFQIIYDRNLEGLMNKHATTLDKILPFAGQCFFGLTVGWTCGRLAHNLYKKKIPILITGVGVYSGVQYLAQKNYVNQKMLEIAFKEKLKALADVNGDNEINREDINALVENRLQFIATKLGPGGIAPGMFGYATVGIGILRGLRRI